MDGTLFSGMNDQRIIYVNTADKIGEKLIYDFSHRFPLALRGIITSTGNQGVSLSPKFPPDPVLGGPRQRNIKTIR